MTETFDPAAKSRVFKVVGSNRISLGDVRENRKAVCRAGKHLADLPIVFDVQMPWSARIPIVSILGSSLYSMQYKGSGGEVTVFAESQIDNIYELLRSSAGNILACRSDVYECKENERRSVRSVMGDLQHSEVFKFDSLRIPAVNSYDASDFLFVGGIFPIFDLKKVFSTECWNPSCQNYLSSTDFCPVVRVGSKFFSSGLDAGNHSGIVYSVCIWCGTVLCHCDEDL